MVADCCSPVKFHVRVCVFVSVFTKNFDKRVLNSSEYDISWDHDAYQIKLVSLLF